MAQTVRNLYTDSLEGEKEKVLCSPCCDDGITKEAMKYCVNCKIYYCEQCVKSHRKIPSVRGHQIVDMYKTDGARSCVPTEKCEIHQEKILDMFCGDHSVLCCRACIADSHRTCITVNYLPDVASGIKESQELKDTRDNLQSVLTKLKAEKAKRIEIMVGIEPKYESLVQEINNIEDELKRKISELAATTRQELHSKYLEISKSVEQDVSSLDKSIKLVASYQERLSEDNETQLFANLKSAIQVLKDNSDLISNLSARNSLGFVLHDELKQLGKMLVTLGTIAIEADDIQENEAKELKYKATLLAKYKINDSPCMVSSVCIMKDDNILVFDNTNNNLKRLNAADFTVVEHLKLDGSSYSICNMGAQEVAVALYYLKKVQFVSVGRTMALTRILITDEPCLEIAFNDNKNEMFISNANTQVKVYNKEGVFLRAYKNDDDGNMLFRNSRSIALSQDDTTVFITDWYEGLLSIDASGALKWVFTDSELKGINGVCVLPGDVILVSGRDSNNVIQVDKYGKKLGTLLGSGDHLINPWALAFNWKTSTLIIGQNCHVLHVYKLTTTRVVR